MAVFRKKRTDKNEIAEILTVIKISAIFTFLMESLSSVLFYYFFSKNKGKTSVKQEPSSGVLSTWMVPLCACAIQDAMESPKPFPGISLFRDLSAR